DLLNIEPGDLLAVEPDRAFIDRVIANDRVEKRCLAGAVGSDQSRYSAPRNAHRNIAVGDNAAERFRHPFDVENRIAHSAAPGSGAAASATASSRSLRSTTIPNHSGLCSMI